MFGASVRIYLNEEENVLLCIPYVYRYMLMLTFISKLTNSKVICEELLCYLISGYNSFTLIRIVARILLWIGNLVAVCTDIYVLQISFCLYNEEQNPKV